MKKLYLLFKEYLSTTDSKFTDVGSKYYLRSGFFEWLGDKYRENFQKLAEECGFVDEKELIRKIQVIQNLHI